MTTTDITARDARPGLVEPQARISEVAITNIKWNMAMAERLVTEVLEKDVDYGRIQGIEGDLLFDPGASKILNGFNTFATHEVLHSVEEEELISFVMQANIISRESGKIVTTGVGACSTRETKYKYRWDSHPEKLGYSPEEIKTLKTKDMGNYTLYRIKNPEYGELANTILTIASKRAEVDAAKSLPGVGSALRKLFDVKLQAKKDPDWDGFWADMSKFGLDEIQVHKILGVNSIKSDWVPKGKTLEQAKKTIINFLAQLKKKAPAQTETEPEDQPGEATPVKATKVEWDKITPSMLTDLPHLQQIMWDLCKIQPADLWKEFGKGSRSDMTITAQEAFIILKEKYCPTA